MTYKVKLVKLSMPRWTKTYTNDIDLKAELYKHICEHCRKGQAFINDDGEKFVLWDPVDENSSVDDMLNTGCGCEYEIEEIDEEI